MATKSKTQRAKASAKRQARKAAAEELAAKPEVEEAAPAVEEKKSLFKKSESANAQAKPAQPAKADKKETKPKKQRFKFFREVRSEMKRVTWPTRTDVTRWSVVVVCALLFFGIYVALLDNAIITPILVFISGLGA